MQPQHTKKRMNFDTNELYLSIPRSYFPAKQNAFNFLININDGGGYLINFYLLNNTSSESFFFPSNIFIIFFSYGFRPAAGLPTLFFNRAKSSRHAVRMRGEDSPLRKVWLHDVRRFSVLPNHFHTLQFSTKID